MEILYNIIDIHLIGGILWFIFYIGSMLITPEARNKFEKIAVERDKKKYDLILFLFLLCLISWEYSAYYTFKKNYKYWFTI